MTKEDLDLGLCPGPDQETRKILEFVGATAGLDGQHCVHWWDGEPCCFCYHNSPKEVTLPSKKRGKK